MFCEPTTGLQPATALGGIFPRAGAQVRKFADPSRGCRRAWTVGDVTMRWLIGSCHWTAASKTVHVSGRRP